MGKDKVSVSCSIGRHVYMKGNGIRTSEMVEEWRDIPTETDTKVIF